MYLQFIRPILFKLSPEAAHNIAIVSLAMANYLPGLMGLLRKTGAKSKPAHSREVFGIKFPHPVGLAAGLDKNAQAFDALGALGFAFVEIGTITPQGQPGNPKPRLFRLPPDGALLNRMGFNNNGVRQAVQKLAAKRTKVIIGGNIGKNKVTPNDKAVRDYEFCFDELYPYVDYFVVNISSPNTPNLRELQDKEPLAKLLTKLMELNSLKPRKKPILLKIAPDLTNGQLDDIIDIVTQTGIAGIVATNTTVSRDKLTLSPETVEAMGAGGISGKPVKDRSTEVIRYISNKTNGTLPIIGVGGIFTAEDAKEKLDAGASLVQIYTGFIYKGPGLIQEILDGLN
jgi:dihydroorotate dehydrogenase